MIAYAKEILQLENECDRLKAELESCRNALTLSNDAKGAMVAIMDNLKAELDKAQAACAVMRVALEKCRDALDKMITHSVELSKDWRTGDFELPELAKCDVRSLEEQFLGAFKALSLSNFALSTDLDTVLTESAEHGQRLSSEIAKHRLHTNGRDPAVVG